MQRFYTIQVGLSLPILHLIISNNCTNESPGDVMSRTATDMIVVVSERRLRDSVCDRMARLTRIRASGSVDTRSQHNRLRVRTVD